MVKPVLLAALICAAPVCPSSAQDVKVSVDMMGIGGMSCAHWQSTQAHRSEGTGLDLWFLLNSIRGDAPPLTPGTPPVRFGSEGCPNTRRYGKRILRAGRWQGLDCGKESVYPLIELPRERLIMADKSKGTWYVSFDLGPGKRTHARATEAFPNEREAKKFARAKLVDTPKVSAGTLNPHLPKRTIAATQMLEWLEEPDEADLA
jgi:hypothetical protein